jgi:hypothetical protein
VTAKRIIVRFDTVKPEGKRQLGKPRTEWENNIKMDVTEGWWEGADWIHLPQDRDWCGIRVP